MTTHNQAMHKQLTQNLEEIWRLRLIDLDAAIQKHKAIETEVYQTKDPLIIAKHCSNAGFIAMYACDYPQAKQKSEEGLERYNARNIIQETEGDWTLVAARLYNVHGLYHLVTAGIGDALVNLKQALIACDLVPQDDLKILILMNIGELYRGILDENEKALPFYEEALKMEGIDDHQMGPVIKAAYLLCRIRMGSHIVLQEDLEPLESLFQQISTHRTKTVLCQLIAQIYKEMQEPTEALQWVNYGLENFNSPHDHFIRLNLWLIGAQAYEAQENWDQALAYAQHLIENNTLKQDNTLLLNLYKLMGHCYGQLKQPLHEAKYLSLALACMEKEMTDHIERHTSVLTAEMKQKTLEKDLEIHRLKNIELKEQSERLEQTALELQAALEDLVTAQEHLVRTEKLAALGELVAGVSHEINTPLGTGITMASFISDIIERLAKALNNKQIEEAEIMESITEIASAVTILNSSLHRAADIVNSFKQVATDQERFELRSFNVSEYLGDLVTILKSQFNSSQYQVSIDCDPELKITSYPGALSQIVNQLTLNAITHGFKNRDTGEINLRIAITKQPKQKLVLQITNNGNPIPKDQRDRIFNPFYTTNRQNGNIGLGLHSLHNLITQVLNGEIHLDDTDDNTHTQFTVTWPVDVNAQSTNF